MGLEQCQYAICKKVLPRFIEQECQSHPKTSFSCEGALKIDLACNAGMVCSGPASDSSPSSIESSSENKLSHLLKTQRTGISINMSELEL